MNGLTQKQVRNYQNATNQYNINTSIHFCPGGELVEVYETSGEDGVIKFAREKLESLMYNDGMKPERIKLADFQKWRQSQVSSSANHI